MDTIGEVICYYRQLRRMTQEEFASKIGVTPQAVSKWERGNGLPDVSALSGISSVLGISADTLLGINTKLVESGDILAEAEIKNNLISEPLVLEFGLDLVPVISEGLQGDYINEKRNELAKRTGMLMPILRVRDNLELGADEYRITIYDEEVWTGNAGKNSFRDMIDTVARCCENNYGRVLNKQLVKLLIDTLKEKFPGIAEGLVPERISYLQVERRLQQKIAAGESIRDMIHILEELEDCPEAG